ncbi:hypothetical protein [Streptomyces sp. NBC_00233]|uniref:hypothetical protein n=1 Tax=Streptomyces sp. NBC_00233 TaxID=2975686 RepID=UPI002251B729|nr:hypothetical protein [Streptomyces sp. NBC_00233]MCX5233256.1 hypothetical protein [Streptomyces sp. NBC_00233]
MARPKWRATGLSEQLHAELVGQRPEPLAALLVDVTRPRVQAFYETWGYGKIGKAARARHHPGQGEGQAPARVVGGGLQATPRRPGRVSGPSTIRNAAGMSTTSG